MNDIVVVEAAYNVNYGFNFPDMSEEFISKTFTLGSALDEACYIAEFDSGIDSLSGIIYFMKLGDPFIGNCNDTDVGLYGTEGIVGSFCTCLCYCIEKCTFSDIRKTYDS